MTPKTRTYGETQTEYGISFREPRRVVEFSLEVDKVRVAVDHCKIEGRQKCFEHQTVLQRGNFTAVSRGEK